MYLHGVILQSVKDDGFILPNIKYIITSLYIFIVSCNSIL